MTAWCTHCGVNFQTDEPLASHCPECREKQNRKLAERMKEAVPLFRGIAERVQAIMNRQ